MTSKAEPMVERSNIPLIAAGFLTLMAVAYLDNIRGPLLPVLCRELGIPYRDAGLFLTVGNIAAVLSVLMLGRILNRYNEKYVLIGACLFSAIPGILAPWISGFWGLLLLGVFIGASVSIIGSLSNILTIQGASEARRGRILSAQQVMYGVGSFLAPLGFSMAMNWQLSWWSVLALATIIFGAYSVGFSRSIDANRLKQEKHSKPHQAFRFRDTSLAQKIAVLTFGTYVGGEVLGSMWMATLMVDHFKLSTTDAADFVGYFFLALAVTRLLSFVFVRPRWERWIIYGSLLGGVIGLSLGQQGILIGFVLAAAVGPFFPLFMAEVSRQFPKVWRQIAIWIFVSIQSSLGMVHLSTGRLSDWLGIHQAFLLAPLLLLITLILYLGFESLCRKARSEQEPIQESGYLAAQSATP